MYFNVHELHNVPLTVLRSRRRLHGGVEYGSGTTWWQPARIPFLLSMADGPNLLAAYALTRAAAYAGAARRCPCSPRSNVSLAAGAARCVRTRICDIVNTVLNTVLSAVTAYHAINSVTLHVHNLHVTLQ